MKKLIEQAIDLLTSKTMCLDDMKKAVELLREALASTPTDIVHYCPDDVNMEAAVCGLILCPEHKYAAHAWQVTCPKCIEIMKMCSILPKNNNSVQIVVTAQSAGISLTKSELEFILRLCDASTEVIKFCSTLRTLGSCIDALTDIKAFRRTIEAKLSEVK